MSWRREGRELYDPGKEQYHAPTRCWRRVTIRWRKIVRPVVQHRVRQKEQEETTSVVNAVAG